MGAQPRLGSSVGPAGQLLRGGAQGPNTEPAGQPKPRHSPARCSCTHLAHLQWGPCREAGSPAGHGSVPAAQLSGGQKHLEKIPPACTHRHTRGVLGRLSGGEGGDVGRASRQGGRWIPEPTEDGGKRSGPRASAWSLLPGVSSGYPLPLLLAGPAPSRGPRPSHPRLSLCGSR